MIQKQKQEMAWIRKYAEQEYNVDLSKDSSIERKIIRDKNK